MSDYLQGRDKALVYVPVLLFAGKLVGREEICEIQLPCAGVPQMV